MHVCRVALGTPRVESEVQKIIVLLKPMNNPLGVSPSKGKQGTTRGKEKNLLTSVGIEPTTSGLDLPLLCRLSYKVELQGRTEKVGYLIRRSWVRFPPRSKDFFFASCGSLFPFSRANAQWVIHGFK